MRQVVKGICGYQAVSVGSLAQSVEQFPFKELVDGSNPSRPTIDIFEMRQADKEA